MDKATPFFLAQGTREEMKGKRSNLASAWLWALSKAVILDQVTFPQFGEKKACFF